MLAQISALLLSVGLAVSPTLLGETAPSSLPPMGWNSWNHYGNAVTERDIRAAAEAIATNGMKEAGYRYINIDDGWQGSRDANGNLRPNAKFTDMRALADYIHSKGLRIGIYSTPGVRSCGNFEGSAGHEDQDAQTFADWGMDYLKYDICSFRKELADQTHGDPALAKQMMAQAYSRMHRALQRTGRPFVFSMSQHGLSEVWTWGADVGAQLWRTGDDVHDAYESVTEIGFAQAGLAKFAGPGHWNDPDMLEIGNGGLDSEESKTQMSLWSLLAAPLLAGNDPSHMSAVDLSISTNPEVIAVDQDPGGRQGDRVWSRGPFEAWARPLDDGSVAVGLFNRNAGAAWMELDPAAFGVRAPLTVRDLWARSNLEVMQAPKAFLIPRHGVLLLKLTPSAGDHR